MRDNISSKSDYYVTRKWMAQNMDAQHPQQPAEGDKGGSLWGTNNIALNQSIIIRLSEYKQQLYHCTSFQQCVKNKVLGVNLKVSHF